MKNWIMFAVAMVVAGCAVEDDQSLRSGEGTCTTSDGSYCTCGTPACDSDGTGTGGGGGGGGGAGGGGSPGGCNVTTSTWLRTESCIASTGAAGQREYYTVCCWDTSPTRCWEAATVCF